MNLICRKTCYEGVLPNFTRRKKIHVSYSGPFGSLVLILLAFNKLDGIELTEHNSFSNRIFSVFVVSCSYPPGCVQNLII